MASIAQILRRAVVEHAQGRCEHCGTAQAIVVEREVNYPCVLDSSGSVGSLGSFFNPWDDRPIGRVHTGIAEAYGAARAFVSTNGTTTAIRLALHTLLTPGDTVLVERECHISVPRGLCLKTPDCP